jgi:5'-methylthioadenosine phosphorylase
MTVQILDECTGVDIGIIGGSGLYSLDDLLIIGEYTPTTPWGKPSDALIIAKTADNIKVAFLARHGRGHYLTPTEVPSRANIAALKHVGVKVILAFSAVGSLAEDIAPKDFVLPSQIIDRTKGIRDSTFYENGVVGHVMFADPFTPELSNIIDKVQQSLNGPKFHLNKTLVCMEGPQFSTRAESHMYRSLGAHIINMSAIPEAKLAKEAEIAYQMICMSTDYDCWRESEVPVTVEEVVGNMQDNAAFAKKLVSALIPVIGEKLKTNGLESVKALAQSSNFAIMTAPEKRNPDTMKKLRYLHSFL